MRLNSDHVQVTHTGSLPRPPQLADRIHAREHGRLDGTELEQLPALIRSAVGEVVRRQFELGIDVISDGEMSKFSYASYANGRLSGVAHGAPIPASVGGADLADFPSMAEHALAGLERSAAVCNGPISYIGAALLDTDIANLTAAPVPESAQRFMNAASPGVIAGSLRNEHYPSAEESLFAIADAISSEYEAIVRAGLILQVDAPDLAAMRHTRYAHLTDAEFVARMGVHVDAINHALRHVAPERVRVHVCWGNYPGPHHKDIDLGAILPELLRLRAHGLTFEAANHRHAHEWQVFAEAAIPDEKLLIPGLIDTSSVYIEHPALIAQRVVRFAQIVGRDRVIAGTDCGFSSYAKFLAVDPELAWAKLDALVTGARLASAQLWRAPEVISR
jgi:5-methyltetrahydropteroyltriglutamate--homocysteine methyltransferase